MSTQDLIEHETERLVPLRKLSPSPAMRARYALLAHLRGLKQLATNADTRRGILCLADQATVSAGNFLTTVIVGRACYQGELGLYALGFSLVIMLTSIPQAVIWTPYTMYSPHMAGRKLAKYTGSVTAHMLTVCLLATIGLAVAGKILGVARPDSPFAAVLCVLPLAAGLMLFRQYIRRVYLARMNIARLLVLDALVSAIQVGGLLLLAYLGWLSASTAFVAVAVACGVMAALWAFRMRGKIHFGRRRAWSDLGRNWRIARWTLWTAMITAFQNGACFWILTYFHGPVSTGIFAAALGLISLMNPLLLGISNFCGPLAAHTLAHSGKRRLGQVIVWSTLGLLATIGPFCVIVSIWGGHFVELLYGPEFSGQGHVVRALALSQVSTAAVIPVGFGLIALGRANYTLTAAVLKMALTLTFGVWCMQHFGAVGAGYGGLAANVGALTLQWFVLRRSLRDA